MDAGVVADHDQPYLGGRFQVWPDRVRPGQVKEQLVPDDGEAGGQHDRGLGRGEVVDREDPEPAGGGQPLLALDGVERGVPRVDQHLGLLLLEAVTHVLKPNFPPAPDAGQFADPSGSAARVLTSPQTANQPAACLSP